MLSLRVLRTRHVSVISAITSFFITTAPTVIYTLSLHDALPISAGGVVPADRQDDVLAAKRREPRGVVLVAHEVERVARIHVGIGIPAGQPGDVVQSGEADDAVHEVGIAQDGARGGVGPEGAPRP